MPQLDVATIALLSGAAFVAGAVNAVAGGGSLISFPALLWAGYTPVVANVTNTVALLPGYGSGTLAYRPELAGQGARALRLVAVSVAGALLGSFLLLAGPASLFQRLVPWLILFSCAVLAAQPAIARWLRSRRGGPAAGAGLPLLAGQLAGAVYGAYFGAGLGVLMLALLGILVDDTLQRLNALKGLLSLVINLVATLCFVAAGRVAWGRWRSWRWPAWPGAGRGCWWRGGSTTGCCAPWCSASASPWPSAFSSRVAPAGSCERGRQRQPERLAQQLPVALAADLDHPEAGEVVGAPLHVEQPSAPRGRLGAAVVGGEQRDQVGERHLGGVGGAVEHRLAGEEAADGEAIEAALELAGLRRPGLDRVGPAEPVEAEVRGADLGIDPRTRAARVGAALDHALEGGVDAHLEAVRRAPQPAAGVEPVEGQDRPRLGRPPRQPAPPQRHREDARPVRGEDGPGLEVAAEADHLALPGVRRVGEAPGRGRGLDGHG